MSYIQYKVNVSKGQEDKLRNAVNTKKAVHLRLSKNDLQGDHMLLLTQAQINQIEKARAQNKGVTLNLSGKQIKANLTVEGGFLGLLAGLASRFLLPAVKTFLPAILGGLASGGIEKAISGSGMEGKDGFFVQKNGECYEGTYTGQGLFLNPSGYRTQYGDGLYLKSGGAVYEGGSILGQIPIIGGLFKLLGL